MARIPETAVVRTRVWTSFDLPVSMGMAGHSMAWAYGTDRQRVQNVVTDGSVTRTIHYLHPDRTGGLFYERESSGTTIENRHFITAGDGVIGVVKTFGNNNATVAANPDHVNYWHKDPLGSVVAVTNASGAVLERMAYDAWGKRLNANGTTDPNGALNPASTDRGYTGHEHLDELGFVHMNGRIYDPLLGRFLSPDPHIQAEELLQNYNRYSYVLNNPLRYTDPSGEFWQIPVFIIGMALAASNNKDLKLIGSMMMMAAMMVGTGTEQGLLVQALGKPGAAFVAATVSTSISTGSLSQGLKSGAFAAAFSYVGGLENLELAEKVVAHAVLGCAQQAASGGQCGPGAAAAAFGKIVSNADVFKETSPSLTQAVATVVAGGTVSVIGGGKFANGAAQAAFGYLFNCVASGCQGKVATLAKALSNEQSAATLRFFNPTDPTPPTPDQISRDAKELSADYIVTATEIQQQGNILQPLTSGVPTTSTVGAAIKAARSFFGFGKVETWDWSSDVDQFSKQLSDRFGAAARNGPGLTFKTRYLELKNGQ